MAIHKRSRMKSVIQVLILIVAVVVSLALSIRGIKGNPTSEVLNTNLWKDEGPFELSPDRGRFALMYSLVEDKSYQFSVDLGRFAAPDVAYSKGRFVSLFAPTLSYIIIPGYMIGKWFGASQVGSFAVIGIFALFNVLLIRAISLKMGAHSIAANLAGLIFLFASPAFAYAVSLYQHHVSTFLILFSIYTLLSWPTWLGLIVVWLCCGLSISVDNPNLFLMFPIGVYALFSKIVMISAGEKKITFNFSFLRALTGVFIILPVAFFLYFNFKSYGNPFQLGGTVQDAAVVTESGQVDISDLEKKRQAERDAAQEKNTNQPTAPKKKEAVKFFKTRKLPQGFYTHFFSLDRGIIMYTPIMFGSIFGMVILARRNPQIFQLLISIIGVNVLLYSMWGDPYGGWAFGSRYLIPTYALFSIFLALTFSRFRRNFIILIPLIALTSYSVWVNTIGALTSNRNPPKVQVLDLESLSGRRERYTYTRNMVALNENFSKSFVFREYARKSWTAWQYTTLVMAVLGTFMSAHVLALILKDETSHE